MKRTALMSSLASVICSALIALVPTSSHAGWGSWGGGSGGGGSYGGVSSYGSYGGVASYGSSGVSYGSAGASYGSSGVSYSTGYGSYGSTGGSGGGGPGPIMRALSSLHQRVHSHFARRASHGSVGGYSGGSGGSGGYATSYGSYGSSYSGGSSGGYSSYSGGSTGGAVSYGSTGTVYAPSYGSAGSSYGSAGSTYYGVSNQSTSTVGSLVSNSAVQDDSVMITVAVPTSAKVYVNNNPTTSKGAVRQYVSRGLVNGKSYKFDIRAEVVGADGKIAAETKSVKVTAGQREAIEFAIAGKKVPVETAVTLHVPEGAKVSLAGNVTSATGSTRTFRTNQLALGQVWDDYTIEVKLGDQTKQQKVRLLAGDQIELTFDFDSKTDRLASR